jgi:hypothetical protein
VSDREAAFYRSHYERTLANIAGNLRELADRVERDGRLRPVRVAEGRDASWSASQVVHAVQWGMANLPLQLLIQSASDIDVLSPEVVRTPDKGTEDGGDVR